VHITRSARPNKRPLVCHLVALSDCTTSLYQLHAFTIARLLAVQSVNRV
jgi:hypothetical protein